MSSTYLKGILDVNASEKGMEQISELTSVSTIATDSESIRSRRYDGGAFLRNPSGTINLRGRDGQVQQLRASFDRVRTSGHAEVVTVCGAAGSGKSALMDSLRQYAVSQNGYIVSGKFDQVDRQDPYSAIVQSCTDLLDLMHQNEHKETSAAIQEHLSQADIDALCQLLSSLGYFSHDQDKRSSPTLSTTMLSFTRLKLLFRSLITAISNVGVSTVVILDDLQFADSDSLELILFLLSDTTMTNFLFVCAYRQENGNPMKFRSDRDDEHLPVTEVVTGELTVESVHEIVQELVKLPEHETTMQLSQLVHSRTQGNCFHVLKFLEQLIADELLMNDSETEMWRWNLDDIKQQTSITDNVLDLVSKQLSRQSEEVRKVLHLASLQGFEFDLALLDSVANECDIITGSCVPHLSVAEQSKLVEKIAEKRYKFSHDHIQSTVKSVIELSGGDLENFYLKVGRFIRTQWEYFNREDWIVFHTVDLMNKGSKQIASADETRDLVELNVSAGQLANNKSAFSSAASYLQYAKNLSEDDIWSKDYDKALELYSTCAEYEFYACHFEECETVVEEILTKSKTPEDKCRAYCVQLESLSLQGQISDSMHRAIDVVNELGVKFPRKPNIGHVVREMIKVRRALFGKTNEDLYSLPMIQCPKIIGAIQALNCLTLSAYLKVTEPDVMALAGLRTVSLTIKHGLSIVAPYAFACNATFSSFLGFYKDSDRFATVALHLLDQIPDTRPVEARALAHLGHLVTHWTRPLTESYQLLQRGCDAGIETGDMYSAFFACVGIVSFSFQTGHALQDIDRYIGVLYNQTQEWGQCSLFATLMPLWQAIKNITGESENPAILEGDILDKMRQLEHRQMEGNATIIAREMLAHKVLCASLFDHWLLVEKILPDVPATLKEMKAHYVQYYDAMYIGLASFEVYRRTKRKKYLFRGLGKLRLMRRKWRQRVCINCELPVAFLNACKVSVLSSDTTKVQKAYDHAIAVAVRNNEMMVQCAANQRAADYFAQIDGKEDLARRYVQDSLSASKRWTAYGLEAHLRRKFNKLIPDLDD